MARIRTIKPDFAFDQELAALPVEARLFFLLSWCHMDRAGRTEDHPGKLRALIYPYHPRIDTERLLTLLHPKFILRYRGKDGKSYLQVRSWEKHQRPHVREIESDIPGPDKAVLEHCLGDAEAVPSTLDKGKGREGNGEGALPGHVVTKTFPPTLDMVKAYCLERGKGVDPETWMNHYQAKGWKIGKTLIKDWKAAVRTWEKNDNNKTDPPKDESLKDYYARYGYKHD